MNTNTQLSLLTEVLEAHGGLERWSAYERMSSTLVSGGRLWGLKGIEMTPVPRVVTTSLRRQWTSMTPFGDPTWTMTWTPEHVVIESGAGEVIAQRSNPAEAFEGHTYDTPWDPLHMAHFNAYAMWTYHALPFVLADPAYVVRDIAPVRHNGENLRGLSVQLPESVRSHTRLQYLYFGADGLLRRHDYEVDVLAGTAAAHLLSEYVEVNGIHLPTRRRVHPRGVDGTLQTDIDVVTIDLGNYTFQ